MLQKKTGLMYVVLLQLIFNNIINFGPAIFASTATNGILRTTNEGANWEFANIGLSNFSISCVKSFGENLFASSLGGGAFKTNNGINWSPVNNGLQQWTVSDLLMTNTRIFILTGAAGIFYSTNSGENWHNLNAKIQPLDIRSMCSNNFFIFSIVTEGVFRSSDNGNTWIFSDIGLQNSGIYSLTSKGNLLICGSNNNGIFRSSDNGNSWKQINNGLNDNLSISSLASINEIILQLRVQENYLSLRITEIIGTQFKYIWL